MSEPERLDERVLVLAPTARDAAASRDLLARFGVPCSPCATIGDVCREIDRGAGATIVTAETVLGDAARYLAARLKAQPWWSDLPVIVLTPPGPESTRLLQLLEEVGPVTLMKRPVQLSAFVSTVRAALRDRRRQYEVRDLLAERERVAEELRAERERYKVTLASIGDAVIATDTEGRVTFLNPVAGELTRWDADAAQGRPLEEVFHIVDEHTRQPAGNPALRTLREGVVVGLANHTMLIARDGTERPIDDSAAPMLDSAGTPVGAVMVFRDVTERRRAQEAQARLAAIVEWSDDAIISKSLDGVIQSWNVGAERLFGYSAAEAVGQPITLIIPPERLDEERKILAQLRQGERVEHIETVRATKSGRLLDISLTVSPVRDDEGRVVGASKVARDISEKKRAEAELRDIRSRIEASLAAGAIGTWSWDVQADRFYGDPSFARIFALPLEAVAGGKLARVVDAIHPDDRARVEELVGRTVETGDRYEADFRVGRSDGSRWVTARGQVERDAAGRPVRFPGVVIDVTEKKRAEEALARATEEAVRQRRMFDTALSHTADFVYLFDTDGRFTYVNKALLNLWGKTLTEAAGKNFFELDYPPDLAARLQRQIQEVIETRQPLRDETPYTSASGTRAYEYIFVPVFGTDGAVEAVAGSTRDITERKRSEEDLRLADRKKDEFIALLAHELRNPLAPIRNGLQVLRLSSGDRVMRERSQAMMDRQLSHMVRLIDDLLDVSRINRNKMELRLARVTLAEVVASAVETAGPAVEEGGHELTVSLPGAAVYLDADLTRLAQVFSNLLTNSAKYTPQGGGGRITLFAERKGAEVAVSVRDTGIGIPPGFLDSIFDMFSQVDRSVERATGGLGIGLALVKGLVEMHRGTVTAASEGEGKGSTFTVTLPVAAGRAEAAVEVPETGHASRPCRRLLVVDDNRDGAESMADMLMLLGHEVRTAHDGEEAVEVAEEFHPEVILMDIGMPRLNGLDATRQIRGQPWGKEMVIIALTGWGQENDRERSFEAGCDGHLVKPVSLPDLEKLLAELKM